MLKAQTKYTVNGHGSIEKINPDLLLSQVEENRVSTLFPRKKPESVISIGNSCISSAGNLTIITGISKGGKSAVIGALVSGCINGSKKEIDCLGFTVKPNDNSKLLLVIDSEMSDYDSFHRHEKILLRAGETREPDFLYNYNFRSIKTKHRFQALELILDKQAENYGGVHCIFIDGIGDFVVSVNDEGECNECVHRFEQIAIKYKCPVIVVLHLNPGSDFKTRGHLGSQSERKAESVLAISKKDNISAIEGKLLRNAGDIPVHQFAYDVDKGMHVSIGVREKHDEKAEIQKGFVSDIVKMFQGLPDGKLSYMELVRTIIAITHLSEVTAKRKIKWLKDNGYTEELIIGRNKYIQLNSKINESEWKKAII